MLVALVTFGEGWHNNHHRYPNSTRQGFFWWEIDISYYWPCVHVDARPGVGHQARAEAGVA